MFETIFNGLSKLSPILSLIMAVAYFILVSRISKHPRLQTVPFLFQSVVIGATTTFALVFTMTLHLASPTGTWGGLYMFYGIFLYSAVSILTMVEFVTGIPRSVATVGAIRIQTRKYDIPVPKLKELQDYLDTTAGQAKFQAAVLDGAGNYTAVIIGTLLAVLGMVIGAGGFVGPIDYLTVNLEVVVIGLILLVIIFMMLSMIGQGLIQQLFVQGISALDILGRPIDAYLLKSPYSSIVADFLGVSRVGDKYALRRYKWIWGIGGLFGFVILVENLTKADTLWAIIWGGALFAVFELLVFGLSHFRSRAAQVQIEEDMSKDHVENGERRRVARRINWHVHKRVEQLACKIFRIRD